MIKSIEAVDLDQAVIFVYPDSNALRKEFESQNSRELNEKQFMQIKLKSIWEEIQLIFDKLASEYFWHDEGVHWEVIDKTASPFNSFFYGKLRFGDGMEDEWFALKLLKELTEANKSLIASIFDTDGDFILIEAAEVLPEWLEPENSKNRVFIHEGEVKIVSNEQFKSEPNLQEALRSIRSGDCPAQVEINRIIKKKIEEDQKIHRTRVRVPLSIAHILSVKKELVGPAVSSFYNREPESMTICTRMPRFNPENSGGPLVLTTIPMTRIQFAQLACQEFVAPQNESVNFQISSCDNAIASELGMKLTCGFEILMGSSEEKFIHKSPFEESKSCQEIIENILKNSFEAEKVICDDAEDSLAWMELSEESLEFELQGRFDNLTMDEDEKSDLIDTWTQEFESGKSKVSEMKGELAEIDDIVDKMKKMIESKSGIEGIDNDDSGSESDTGDSDDSVCSEDDENLLEREIFETINFDPDLLMKILEANAHMEVSSEEFLERFRKYQQENPTSITSKEMKLKGIADIDAVKVAEARKSSRKVFDEKIVDDDISEDEKESITDTETECVIDNNSDTDDDDDDVMDDVLDDEYLYGGQTLDQLKTSTLEIDPEESSNFQEYYEIMDRQLQTQLSDPDQTQRIPIDDGGDAEIKQNLGKNLIESFGVAGTGTTNHPVETIVSGLKIKIPRPSS